MQKPGIKSMMLTRQEWIRFHELRNKKRNTEEELEYMELCVLQNQGVTLYETSSSN